MIDLCSKCGMLVCECNEQKRCRLCLKFGDWQNYDGLYLCPSCRELDLADPDNDDNDDIPDNTINTTSTVEHSEKCQFCGAVGPWFKYMGDYTCKTCREKEIELQKQIEATADERVQRSREDVTERQNSELVQETRAAIDTLAKSIEIDQGIRVNRDIFNARTVSIIHLKQIIDDDDSIDPTQKHFELAKKLKDRFLHLRSVLFDVDTARVAVSSEQKSIQVYLNDLATRLRTEEREKLKIADLNYSPKPPVKPSIKKVKKKKFDKKELAALAKENGISAFTIQTLAVAKDVTAVEAVELIKQLAQKEARK